MNAERYLREKERLTCELHGKENLEKIVSDFVEVLQRHNIELTLGMALDLFCFTLETLYLDKFDLCDRMEREIAHSRKAGS